MPLSIGTRLGPCEILKPIGAGGMGEVYRATETRLIAKSPSRFAMHRALPEFLLMRRPATVNDFW
jgi:hypothetical protein